MCKSHDGQKQQIVVAPEGSLLDNHLRPGSGVSVDNFEYQPKECTYNYFGSSTSEQYVVVYIFVDHMSGYINLSLLILGRSLCPNAMRIVGW